MAALRIDRTAVSPDFADCNLVHLYCVEGPELEIVLEDFDIVTVKLRQCHVSVLTDAGQRRYALIADRGQWGRGHKAFPAPKLLLVTTSCVAKWAHDGGDHYRGTCIWEWGDVTNMPPTVPSPGQTTFEHLPLLDAGDCTECCPVTVPQPPSATTTPQVSSDAADDDDDDLDVHIIKLRGSTLEKRYQDALEEVRHEMMVLKRTVPIKLVFEPDNPVDRNAVKIDAKVNDVWKIVGYIPVEKIPKVTKALRNDDIVSVKFASVPRFEIHPVQCGFGASITVLKKGKWPLDDKKNTYNSDLSNL